MCLFLGECQCSLSSASVHLRGNTRRNAFVPSRYTSVPRKCKQELDLYRHGTRFVPLRKYTQECVCTITVRICNSETQAGAAFVPSRYKVVLRNYTQECTCTVTVEICTSETQAGAGFVPARYNVVPRKYTQACVCTPSDRQPL